jgi:exonuclease III
MDNFNVKQNIIVEMQRLCNDANWNLEYDWQSIQLESCISILSLNTHSLHAHINDIVSDYDTMQSDILCIQETYMMLPMQNEQFPSFNCVSNCNKHGVMILVKKHLPILEHMHFEELNVEVLVARVTVKGLHIANEYLCSTIMQF